MEPITAACVRRVNGQGIPPIGLCGRNVGISGVSTSPLALSRYNAALPRCKLVQRGGFTPCNWFGPSDLLSRTRGRAKKGVAGRLACDGGTSKCLAEQTSVCTETANDSHAVYSLEDVLRHVREAMGVETTPEESLILVEGSQNNLGMDGSWQLLFSPEGGFLEGFQGEEIANCGGFDGVGCVWDIDTAGRVSHLDLDDREEVLLATWLRTGQWLLPAARCHLDLQLFSLTAKLRERGSTGDGAMYGGGGLGFMGGMGMEEEEGIGAVNSSVEEEVRRLASGMKDALLLTISLKGCKVLMHVIVPMDSWLPRYSISRNCGAVERIVFDDYLSPIDSLPTLLLPRTVTRQTSAGAYQQFRMTNCLLLSSTISSSSSSSSSSISRSSSGSSSINGLSDNGSGSEVSDNSSSSSSRTSISSSGNSSCTEYATASSPTTVSISDLLSHVTRGPLSPSSSPFLYPLTFSPPHTDHVTVTLPLTPLASYNDDVAPEIPLLQSPSGHLLVRPLINGQDVGYFILDTGASCFTIESDVADRLSLPSFGCVHVVTVHGPSECSFRRASDVQLGPLHISNALLLDIKGAALVPGVHPVVGIVGYDIFRHSLVHVHRSSTSSSSSFTPRGGLAQQKWEASLYRPTRGVDSAGQQLSMQATTVTEDSSLPAMGVSEQGPGSTRRTSNGHAVPLGGGRSGESSGARGGLASAGSHLLTTAALSPDGLVTDGEVEGDFAPPLVRTGGAGGWVMDEDPASQLIRQRGSAGGRVGSGVNGECGGYEGLPAGFLDVQILWEGVRMLGSVPHINLQFQEHVGSPLHDAVFLLDSGAAGTGLIFNGRAVDEFGLGRRVKASARGRLKGMGSSGEDSGQGMSVTQGVVSRVIVAGQVVNNVDAIFCSSSEEGALELSHYACGLACRNLLMKFDVLFDYSSLRVGIIPHL